MSSAQGWTLPLPNPFADPGESDTAVRSREAVAAATAAARPGTSPAVVARVCADLAPGRIWRDWRDPERNARYAARWSEDMEGALRELDAETRAQFPEPPGGVRAMAGAMAGQGEHWCLSSEGTRAWYEPGDELSCGRCWFRARNKVLARRYRARAG